MIVIVVDSTAYLTRTEAVTNGVMVVPMSYSVDGGANYFEGYVDDSDAYEQLVADNLTRMHTSQVPYQTFMRAFGEMRAAGHDVLCVTLSSRLSGTYSNASIAAQEIGGEHIEVVDSRLSAGGLALMVKEGRRLIEGGMKLSEVAEALRKRRQDVRTVFSVDDMEALRRSGRLGNVKMSISTILNIKPLLKMDDGSIVSGGIARGQGEQIKKMLQMVDITSGTMVVEQFLGAGTAQRLVAMLEARGFEVKVRRVGPVLGVHLGHGSVGITWVKREANGDA